MRGTWDQFILNESKQLYFNELSNAICKDERAGYKICPEDKFRIFKALPYKDIKVVVLGQDPYYASPNEANGFAFAVSENVAIPPSLRNIFKEIASDLGTMPNDRTLEYLVEQGVFLLNTALTTRHGEALAHSKFWQPFTDKVISFLNERVDPIIFLLWGGKAIAKKALITGEQHYILESTHPSPLSSYRGFFGCKHFSKANKILMDMGKEEIDWAGEPSELEF